MKKRILPFFLAIVLIIASVPPITVHAATAGVGPRVLEGGQRNFKWPVPSSHGLSGCFKDGRNHDSIDIVGNEGDDVVASYDGVVYEFANSYRGGGYGNYVIIEHDYKLSTGETRKLYTKYNHLRNTYVSKGETVKGGVTVIGAVGHTGGEYASHLDFQILTNPNWDNFQYHKYSIDPFINDLLELPADIWCGATPKCCSTSVCCCDLYLEAIKAQYAIPLCDHGKYYSNVGKCTRCGFVFDWKSTESTSSAGYYTVTKPEGLYLRLDAPYDASASKSAGKLARGETVKVIASYENAFGHTWYKVSNKSGTLAGYAYSGWFKFQKNLESNLSINITWPYENQTISRSAHSLMGTISSNYAIKKASAYLDGTYVGSDSPNKTSFSLAGSNMDYALTFNTLQPGRHVIRIDATDAGGGSTSFSRVFYTESYPCDAASVSTTDINGGKRVVISCPGANISYTTNTGLSGRESGSVSVNIKNTTTFTITTSKSGYVENKITKTVTVEQVQAPAFSVNEKYDGTYVTITSTPGATIYYYFDGTQHGQYCETIRVTGARTLHAYAVKLGMADSPESVITIEETKPQTPIVTLSDTPSKLAVGKTAVFKWSADVKARSYNVSVYKDGELLETTEQTENVFSYVLRASGTYSVSVKACSPLGDSAESSRVTVEAMDPLTVRFLDEDGTVLNELLVDYGDYLPQQTTPSHKGHYFSGWEPTNNYTETPVTEDMAFRATYTPIEYDVMFYDVDGVKIGETQKVPYQQSAVAPDYSSRVPVGYIFAGWTVIEASDKESICDYQCVDADLKLQAVIRWENDELPVHVAISSAEVAPEGNDSVYTVKVDATNWPTDASNIYLVAALKTQDADSGIYKTVYAERSSVNLAAGQTRTVTIPLHYNGIAKNVEVYALERKSDGTTGSAYSEAASTGVVFSTTWTDWSEWSTTKPESKDGRTIETKTQYRYQDKETTSSSSSSLSGWTQYDSSWAWGSWGSWSSWGPTSQTSSDSKQVESRTEWRYYYFYCPVCGGHEPFKGMSDCGRYSLSSSNWNDGWFPTAYKNSNSKTYSYTSYKRYTESLGDGQRWNFSTGNLYDTAPGTVDAAGSDVIIRTAYRYRTRNQVWTYYYYRWTPWSDWSDTQVSASSNRTVEEQTLYRYRDEVKSYDTSAGTEDNSGQSYHFEGTVGDAQDLSGKVATIMVYQSKNMDPNQYQMQYIGQTTILPGNRYDFSFIPIHDPTVESGNYVVSIGVQGTTGLLSVDVVKAPVEQYTVRFLNEDGSLIDTQTVEKGGNAVVPSAPKKDGYRFTGWSMRTTDIYKNCDIYAQFEKEQYTVVFVDWVNGTIGFQNYYYGDTITAPYAPSAEGRIFKGWDALLNGNTTVKDNMVITAVYDVQTFKVRFMDENGNAFEEQQVAYGEAAVLPDALTVAGKVFLGWSTECEWWNVTSDMEVYPLLAYPETAMAPVFNSEAITGGLETRLELMSEENAVIYYTLDGSIPTKDSPVYTDAIHLAETAQVIAFASVEGKNDSSLAYVFFRYDDSGFEQKTEDELIALDAKDVSVAADLEVPVEVEIAYNPGLIAFEVVVECDRSVFYIDADEACLPSDITQHGTFTVAPYETTGWKIIWLSTSPCTGDGTLFTLPLKVDEEAEPGLQTVTLSYVSGTACRETGEEATITPAVIHFTGAEPHVHVWDEGTVTTPPSELNEGVRTFVCRLCGTTKTEPIPKIVCNGDDTCPSCNLSDVPAPSSWAHAGIDYAIRNGFMNGMENSQFQPNTSMTRGMLVTVLWRYAGSPEEGENNFTDVAADRYYTKAVAWAAENGIVNGIGDRKFDPDGNITREQLATILFRYCDKLKISTDKQTDLSSFPDAETVGKFATDAMQWAVAESIINGSDGKLLPKDNATRAQVATILMRFIENILK